MNMLPKIRTPLTAKTKALLMISVIWAILLLSYMLVSYISIPHGSEAKEAILILAVVIAPIYALFLTIVRYRFILVEKYPYLINLPAFSYLIIHGKLSDEDRGRLINAVLGTATAFALIFINVLFSYVGLTAVAEATYGVRPLPDHAFVIGILAVASSFCLALLLYFRRLYRSLLEKVMAK